MPNQIQTPQPRRPRRAPRRRRLVRRRDRAVHPGPDRHRPAHASFGAVARLTPTASGARGSAPRAPRRCARCRRRRRPPARPAASARSTAARRGRRPPRCGWSAARRSPAGRCGRRRRPGSAADRPAPAMITRRPAHPRVLGVVGDRVGLAVGGHHAHLGADAALGRARASAFSIAGMSLLEPITIPTRGASTSSSSMSAAVSAIGSRLARGARSGGPLDRAAAARAAFGSLIAPPAARCRGAAGVRRTSIMSAAA